MKTKTIYLLALLLCIAAACKKDNPYTPIPPPEPVKKYLAKVLIAGTDSNFYEIERCTWDSLHRLKTYRSVAHAYVMDAEFYYDSIGRVYRVDYNAPSLGVSGLCFVFDWKNEKELNGIDIYMHNIFFDTTYYACRDTYLYDESSINIRIERVYVKTNHTTICQIEWDGLNITSTKGPVQPCIDNQKFDDKYSPWSVFPDLFIAGLAGDMNSVPLYNPSKNNPIEGNDRKYEYEYDEDGYPIHQYYIREDDTKDLLYIFEYYN
ncbi:MAG: hypothetical protein FWE93_07435 [Alphaproteobacteria bacterium]|nr:hypothetical protein [Alphaproteobacteria bacterium]